MAMRASFEEVQPASLEFVLAWSRREAEEVERRRARERARLLGLVVDLGDDDDDVAVERPRL